MAFVWITSACLAALAWQDRRARPMVGLLALVVIQTSLAEILLLSRPTEVAAKVPIDLCAGLLALMIAQRDRWLMVVPALFVVTLVCHAAFWLTHANGGDIWLPYANALNVLYLGQLAALAWPTGGQWVGRARDWLNSSLNAWGRGNNVGDWEATRSSGSKGPISPANNRPSYEWPRGCVHIPDEA